MRLALFETSGESCSVALDKVLHVLTAPPVFKLPLLNQVFVGSFIYHGQIVPLLRRSSSSKDQSLSLQTSFVIVCEAEFGLVGVPADRIMRITKAEEVGPEGDAMGFCHGESFEINGCNYRQLDLNAILGDPDFSMCGLKDLRRLA